MNTDVITPPAAVTVIGLGNMGVPSRVCSRLVPVTG
jgi:hypothetical protein